MTPAFSAFLLAIAARTVIVVVFLIVGLRLLGKRELGQMNIYDLALIMALANAVQNAMTNGNGNLSVGLVSSGTLLLIGWAITRLFVRLPRIEERIVGMPTLLLSDGQFIPEHLRRECVTEQQVMTAMRQHGLTDPREVLMAVLEVDGSISIVPKTADHRRTRKRAGQRT